jgi:UDPglucose 6-dehydrogenase
MASAGHSIFGIDKSNYVIENLRNGLLPFYESDLSELFETCKSNFLDFSTSFDLAIEETDVSVVLVNTQLGNTGYSSELVEEVVTELAFSLGKTDKNYHLVVISSTLLPGTMSTLVDRFQEISGRIQGIGFGFVYVPDFVKLGSVISDFMNPEFVLIGAQTENDFKISKDLWSSFIKNEAPISLLSMSEAEIAKVALNAYLVNKITFVNFLGLLCRDIQNVNVKRITDVIGQDRRISPYFFRSGTPFGGTCFPRDTSAFIAFSEMRGLDAEHMLFAEKVNKLVLNDLISKVEDLQNIGILGISFKESSPVTTGSPAISLILELQSRNKNINVFDYLSDRISDIPEGSIVHPNPQSCIDASDAVILMHLNKQFCSLSFDGKILIDPWNQVN